MTIRIRRSTLEAIAEFATLFGILVMCGLFLSLCW